MRRAPRAALKIDMLVNSDCWTEFAVKSIVRRAVTQAAAVMESTRTGELAIVLTDDSAIRALNRDWRGIDAPTNVLSFPANQGGGHFGDIVIAFETTAQEARREQKPFAHHVAHLAVHGFLHLVGFDHDDDDDAEAMENVERAILHALDIPDPYRRQRGGNAAKAAQRHAQKSARVSRRSRRPRRS
jgi:probable rRNA maturation factor